MRPRRPRSKARRRSRSPGRGRAACWSPPAQPSGTSSARRSGATGSPSLPSATAAATCSPSAGPNTARSPGGAGTGGRQRRCSRRRWRTSRTGGRPGCWRRSWAWRSSGEDRGEGGGGDAARAGRVVAIGALCRGRLALDRGETARGRARGAGPPSAARRAAARTPARTQTARRCPGGTRRARRAEAALEELHETVRLVGTRALQAAADRAEGALAAAGGDHDLARRLLEDAVDGYERAGATRRG